MKEYNIISSTVGFFFIVLCFQLCNGATNIDIEVKKFISDANIRNRRLFDQIAAEIYSSQDNDDFDTIFKKLSTVQIIAKEVTQISKEAREFDRSKIQDPDSLNAINYFRRAADIFVLEDEYFSSVLINLNALEELSSDKDIPPYMDGAKMPNQDSSPIAYNPDIKEIVRTSNDSDELKYYWKTWRDMNSLWASINFSNIIEAIEKAAKLLEIDVIEFWYNLNQTNFIDEMENVMTELAPAYKQLHAFIRNELHNKYGIDLNDPIPAHLFEQVMEQAWHNGSILESYFPHKDLPPYDSFVQHYNALDMVKEAVGFYKSLGFEDFNDDFYKNHIVELDTEPNDGECRAGIFDLTPNVYMKYCLKVDFRKFLQNHGYMGSMFYAKQKQDLPFYYFESYLLEYPIGEAVILSASSPKHLQTIGLAKDFKFEDKTLMNRLFRMGIHTLLNVPLFFVHTKVIDDLLRKKIDMEGLNKHYWKLMVQYAGVEPPDDRSEGKIDFPHKFYLDLDQNHQTEKFISEILGYQFYSAFCKRSSTNEPLHNCDFYGNLDVGNDMKAMMSLGSSKPRREVLAKILPDNTNLSAKDLLDYYKPMLEWLEAKNEETKVKIGWNESKKKVL